MNDRISLGGTDLTKKPKYVENFWKNFIFIYACLILSLTLSLSVNSISFNTTDSTNGKKNSTNMVLDVFLTLLYAFASSILIALFLYLHINRNQTFEEAKKENSKSSEIHYSMCGEKVGLYLRFGVVLIGALSLIHIALSNAMAKTYLMVCDGLSTLFSSIFQSIFFIIQTVFILKYHSVVILKNTRLIQFGLYSIVFINITIWEISSLKKIKYSSTNTLTNTSNCTDEKSESLYLYFLPAVSEYCVICMAIIYEIMKRLGRISLIETSHTEHQKNIFWKIRKSVSGVIIGILIALITIGFTIGIIIMDNNNKDKSVFIVHNVEEIVLYIFSIVILILAFLKTNQLKFSFTYLSNNVDKNLLFVSCFLSIAFSVLLSTFCFQSLKKNYYPMLIRAITAILEIIQIIIQTYVIQDAFYRCSDNVEQQETKPGQGYLAILVGCNFGLWLFKSFQLKNGDIYFHKSTQSDKGPDQAILTFFVYLTLPLSILYRYHSSSCLADVFSKIYQGEACRFEGLLRAEGFEKCGIETSGDELKNNIPKIVIEDGLAKVGRPRAITLPEIYHVVEKTPKSLASKKMARRETIKNLETAKLRVLSSHFSHNMVTKKLSATVAPSMNSSTPTLDESDNEKNTKLSAKLSPRFAKKNLNTTDSDMSTIKHLVVGNLFNSSLKRRNSNDEKDGIILKTVKFQTNPIIEQNGEEMNF